MAQDLDEIQAYILVHRCAEGATAPQGAATALAPAAPHPDAVIALYFHERLRLLRSTQILLELGEGVAAGLGGERREMRPAGLGVWG